jgi:benzoyl-CoA reductase/2-hydroxyglutaryl-CoA dehydratase subunit BcrC/BadD/HgdB
MKTLEQLLDECEQDPTTAARRAKAAGQPVIGFVGADVPVELIDAAGAFALSLTPSTPGATPEADRYLEASFSRLERSIAQRWLSGALDFLDAVVLSRGSDGSQRLYYYLCELQRRSLIGGARPLLYDLAKIPRASSANYSFASTRELATALGSDGGRLEAAIARRNRRRQLLQTLQQRRASPAPPSGTLCERVGRLADCCAADEFDAALSGWLGEPTNGVVTGPRLLLAGSSPGGASLHRIVEKTGGVIVAEAGDHDLTSLGLAVTTAGTEPLRALSDHYHALPYGTRAFVDREADLGRRVTAIRAQGVIIWLIEEEEALVWDLPGQRRRLQQLGVPTLALTRQHAGFSDEALASVRDFTAQLAAGT